MRPVIECRKTRWVGDPFSLYRAWGASSPSALLESARPGPHTGRYSILAADPFLTLRYERGRLTLEDARSGKVERRDETPFALLKELLREYSAPPEAGWPSFATGAIGYAGYECKELLEPRAGRSVGKPRLLPDMYFLFFDGCVVWDHERRELWLCALRHGRSRPMEALERKLERARRRTATPVNGRHPPRTALSVETSLDEGRFMRAVRQAKRHIRHGEIFQANLSQCFSFDLPNDPREIYARLREINPSPFFGVLDAKDFQIVSGSPERLLKLEGRSLETRPIAGTRARGKDDEEDKRQALDLLLSDKERAEHVMLVDLERNDLGRVAEYGSVAVDELMALEDYSHVKHIVSNVRATLREGLDAVDAFCALFPGGTITGAPKVRCMQIIEELEPVARGPYTGSLGYFSFTGNMDFNILIRSLAVRGGRAFLHAGAGIVADSQPKKEYDETLYKAEAVLSAVFGEKEVRSFFRRRGVAGRLS